MALIGPHASRYSCGRTGPVQRERERGGQRECPLLLLGVSHPLSPRQDFENSLFPNPPLCFAPAIHSQNPRMEEEIDGADASSNGETKSEEVLTATYEWVTDKEGGEEITNDLLDAPPVFFIQFKVVRVPLILYIIGFLSTVLFYLF